jgi:hypothetical protein
VIIPNLEIELGYLQRNIDENLSEREMSSTYYQSEFSEKTDDITDDGWPNPDRQKEINQEDILDDESFMSMIKEKYIQEQKFENISKDSNEDDDFREFFEESNNTLGGKIAWGERISDNEVTSCHLAYKY